MKQITNMKKNNSFLSSTLSLFLVSLLLTVVSACKEDGESKTSNTDFLTTKNWKPVQYEGTVNGVVDKNAVIKECDKDDVLTFTADGKYFADLGPNYCDEGRKEEIGMWEWKNKDEKILRTVLDGVGKDFEFVRLTNTTFKVTYSERIDLDRDNVDDDIKYTFIYAAL
jgi:hypothetical protein